MTSQKIVDELMLTLWNSCHSRCTFCYNQCFYHYPLDIKEHLKMCNNILKSNFMENFQHLRFLGGELFDGSMHDLSVEKEFDEILNNSIALLKNNSLIKVNFLTNLMYKNQMDLRYTIDKFEKNKVIDKLAISTSYDVKGRFTEETEQNWWNNLLFIKNNYPNISLDIGIIMTQALIEKASKEWIEEMKIKTMNSHISFSELDTAVIRIPKNNSPFKELFPKRRDFVKFLKNMRDWGYIHMIGLGPENSHPMHLLFTNQFTFPVYKNLDYMLPEREEHKEDGYIDSSIPLFDDVKKILKFE